MTRKGVGITVAYRALGDHRRDLLLPFFYEYPNRSALTQFAEPDRTSHKQIHLFQSKTIMMVFGLIYVPTWTESGSPQVLHK